MATIKSFTDLSQSKKLAEFLSHESADMYRVFENNAETRVYYGKIPTAYFVCEPCWSLAALIRVLPEIQGGKPVISLDDNYITYPHMSDLHTKADNIVDACYEMVLRLHERKML